MFKVQTCPKRGRCGCRLSCKDRAADMRAVQFLMDELAVFESLRGAILTLKAERVSPEAREEARRRIAVSFVALRNDDPAKALEEVEHKLSELRRRVAGLAAGLVPGELNDLIATARHSAEVAAAMSEGGQAA